MRTFGGAKLFLRQAWAGAWLLGAGLASAGGEPPGVPLAAGFEPIPAQFIYPPLKANGSADDALASGQVRNEKSAMAPPASKPWRIAFLFPHLKDPYWLGCNYGLIGEA